MCQISVVKFDLAMNALVEINFAAAKRFRNHKPNQSVAHTKQKLRNANKYSVLFIVNSGSSQTY